MPACSVTATKRKATRRPSLKFPCGHLEPEAAVQKRTRTRGHAVWVRCRVCNLIALAVAVEAKLTAG